MVMYARTDQLEVMCEARPGSSHVRPHRTKDPDSDFVSVWGVDCKPCETGHLKTDPHWAKQRSRVPLTPDEVDEARMAIEDAARMDAQIKLMEARERIVRYRELQASGVLEGMADPDDVAITTASDTTTGSVGEATVNAEADTGASYRALTVKDLRDLSRDRGISSGGTKDELVDRHVGYDKE